MAIGLKLFPGSPDQLKLITPQYVYKPNLKLTPYVRSVAG